MVVEAVFQIVGHRDGVLGHLGIDSQSSGHELPVEIGADGQAHANPDLIHPGGVDRPGQAQQQPAAHIRGPGAQGSHPGTQAPSPQDVVGQVGGHLIGHQTDGQHPDQIDDKGDQGRCTHLHGLTPVR